MAEIVVRQALTLEGIVYGPDSAIPPEVWQRVPERGAEQASQLGEGAEGGVVLVGPFTLAG